MNTIKCKYGKKISWNVIVLLCIVMCVCVVSYGDFIFGRRDFILNHDVYNQFIPELTNFWDLVRGNGELPIWSFNKGLGQEAWINNPSWVGDIFTWLLLFVPRDTIPRAFIFIHILKICLSAYFFYKYLEALNMSTNIRVIFAFAYAFNGHMIYRGLWLHYSTDVVLTALLLWSLELYLQRKNRWSFPVALALLFSARYVAYAYVYSLFLLMYIIFRHLQLDNRGMREFVRECFDVLPGYLLGIGLASPFIFPGIYYMLSAPRITGESSLFKDLVATSPIALRNFKAIIEWIYRSFSGIIVGITLPDGSFSQLLEPAINYCGILTLLLIPQVILIRNKKIKQSVVFLVLMCLAYNTMSYIGYFFGAFMGAAYKTTGFWSIVFFILIAVYVTKELETGGINCVHAKFLLGLTVIIYITGVLLLQRKYTGEIKQEALIQVVILILLWGATLLIFAQKTRRSVFVLIILFSVEIILNLRMLNTSTEIRGFENNHIINAGEYDDGTYETIREIEKRDTEFFRVKKQYEIFRQPYKFEINQAQVQDYHGLPYYTSVKSNSAIDFYDFFNLEYNNLLLKAFNEREILCDFLNVKYLLVKDEMAIIPSKYKFIFKSKSGIDVYRNENAIPLGMFYSQIKKESEALEQTALYRENLILQEGIVPDKIYEQSVVSTKSVEKKNCSFLNIAFLNATEEENHFPQNVKYKNGKGYSSTVMQLDNDEMQGQYKYIFKLNIYSKDATTGILYYSETEQYGENRAMYFDVSQENTEKELCFYSSSPISFLRLDVLGDNNEVYLSNVSMELQKEPETLLYDDLISGISYEGINHIKGNLPQFIEYSTLGENPNIQFQIASAKSNRSFHLQCTIKSNIETLGQVYYGNSKEGYFGAKYFSIKKGKHKYSFDFGSDAIIELVRLDVGDTQGIYEISDLDIVSCPLLTDEEITYYVGELQETAMQLKSWGNTKIEGVIKPDESGVICFSIPYDKGWRLYVDGVITDTFAMNGGMTGAIIASGMHEILLKYALPGFDFSLICWLLSSTILVISCIRQKKKNLNNSCK